MIRNFDGDIKFLTDIHKPLPDQLAFLGTHYSPDLQTLQLNIISLLMDIPAHNTPRITAQYALSLHVLKY